MTETVKCEFQNITSSVSQRNDNQLHDDNTKPECATSQIFSVKNLDESSSMESTSRDAFGETDKDQVLQEKKDGSNSRIIESALSFPGPY